MLTFNALLGTMEHKKAYNDQGPDYFDERHLGFKPNAPKDPGPAPENSDTAET